LFAFAFAFTAGLFAVALETALAAVFAAVAAVFAAVAAWLAAFAIALAAVFIALATFLLAFAVVLLAVLSPQAMPRAPSAKRLESAMIFFISKWTLLSFSKNILTYFYLPAALRAALLQNIKFWNNRQYSHPEYISQPLK
jgi:hypothetical protein